jgi:hypothetical protein
MARQPKQSKPEFNLDSILNNPVDSKTLQGFIDEAVLCREAKKSQNEAEADIRNEARDKLGIPPAMFNFLVKTRFADSLKTDKDKVEAGETVMEKLYGVSIEE